MMPYNHTNFRVKTHHGVGSVGKKVVKTGVGNHLETCPPISVSIDRTSPKFLWWIALLKVYRSTKFRGETYQGAGSAAKKS